MRTLTYSSWKEFRQSLNDYASEPRLRREQLIFRGHSSMAWKLCTTLDRCRNFRNDQERNSFMKALLKEFRHEAIRLGVTRLPQGDGLELLARHQRLPSMLLDWTNSPYVASFFAYDGVVEEEDHVAILALDRAELQVDSSELDIIDDYDLFRYNIRALQQQSLFLRVATARRPLEELFESALTVFKVPAADRKIALADLDEMSINHTNLFRDLEAAARTAYGRIMEQEAL